MCFTNIAMWSLTSRTGIFFFFFKIGSWPSFHKFVIGPMFFSVEKGKFPFDKQNLPVRTTFSGKELRKFPIFPTLLIFFMVENIRWGGVVDSYQNHMKMCLLNLKNLTFSKPISCRIFHPSISIPFSIENHPILPKLCGFYYVSMICSKCNWF